MLGIFSAVFGALGVFMLLVKRYDLAVMCFVGGLLTGAAAYLAS